MDRKKIQQSSKSRNRRRGERNRRRERKKRRSGGRKSSINLKGKMRDRRRGMKSKPSLTLSLAYMLPMHYEFGIERALLVAAHEKAVKTLSKFDHPYFKLRWSTFREYVLMCIFEYISSDSGPSKHCGHGGEIFWR